MVPFQSDIIKSSGSFRPYEQASVESLCQSRGALRIEEYKRRAATCSQSLLALLELFQKAEVPRHLGSHLG